MSKADYNCCQERRHMKSDVVRTFLIDELSNLSLTMANYKRCCYKWTPQAFVLCESIPSDWRGSLKMECREFRSCLRHSYLSLCYHPPQTPFCGAMGQNFKHLSPSFLFSLVNQAQSLSYMLESKPNEHSWKMVTTHDKIRYELLHQSMMMTQFLVIRKWTHTVEEVVVVECLDWLCLSTFTDNVEKSSARAFGVCDNLSIFLFLPAGCILAIDSYHMKEHSNTLVLPVLFLRLIL
jgi:hypothetical protein